MYNQANTNTRSENGFQYAGHGCGSFKNKFAEHFGRKGKFDRFFGTGFINRKAANIQENDTSFVISLYAAGLSKSHFKVSVSNDILTIVYTAPEANESVQYSHQEYEFGSFERSFQLNGQVLTDHINAAYLDGVLTVTLPKDPEAKVPAQEVKID